MPAETPITLSLIGGRLIDTRRCSGWVPSLLLAGMVSVPMMQRLVDEAFVDVVNLSGDKLVTERAKLDMCVASMRDANMIS